MTSTPSPGQSETSCSSPAASGAMSEKSRRYDRQLRLWGDHGQAALERAHVCLIHATATGTEILKSLVLPGIGAFTIVDEKKINGEDVGNNFFLDKESFGQPRGNAAARLLLEMNQEVRGNCVDESPEKILNENPDFFKTFNIVIATDVCEKSVAALSKLLWEANIPFMVVKSYGFIGYIRLQVKEHTVIESHPDNALEDLRLDAPFPTLVEYMNSLDLDKMTKQEHSHTPYVVILYKFLQIWREEHGGDPPKNYKEKKEFKNLLTRGIMKREDGLPEEEENFEEAMRAVNSSLAPSHELPANVKEIFNDEKCIHPSASCEEFWIIARAVKDFVETTGLLPLRGTIPDMTSDSVRYVRLQNVYREKALDDAAEVFKKVQDHLEAVGKSTESISEASVRKFCKEASNLRLVRCAASIAEEYEGRSEHNLAELLEQNPESDLIYYLVLRGVDRFFTEHSAYPGALVDHVEPDNSKLKATLNKVLSDYHISNCPAAKDEYIHEVCRYGAAELHSIAAFMGNCAAHEVIKLLTKQYVPVSNLFIYNAMSCETMTVKI